MDTPEKEEKKKLSDYDFTHIDALRSHDVTVPEKAKLPNGKKISDYDFTDMESLRPREFSLPEKAVLPNGKKLSDYDFTSVESLKPTKIIMPEKAVIPVDDVKIPVAEINPNEQEIQTPVQKIFGNISPDSDLYKALENFDVDLMLDYVKNGKGVWQAIAEQFSRKPDPINEKAIRNAQLMGSIGDSLGLLSQMFSANQGAHIRERNGSSALDVTNQAEKLRNAYNAQMDKYNALLAGGAGQDYATFLKMVQQYRVEKQMERKSEHDKKVKQEQNEAKRVKNDTPISSEQKEGQVNARGNRNSQNSTYIRNKKGAKALSEFEKWAQNTIPSKFIHYSNLLNSEEQNEVMQAKPGARFFKYTLMILRKLNKQNGGNQKKQAGNPGEYVPTPAYRNSYRQPESESKIDNIYNGIYE